VIVAFGRTAQPQKKILRRFHQIDGIALVQNFKMNGFDILL